MGIIHCFQLANVQAEIDWHNYWHPRDQIREAKPSASSSSDWENEECIYVMCLPCFSIIWLWRFLECLCACHVCSTGDSLTFRRINSPRPTRQSTARGKQQAPTNNGRSSYSANPNGPRPSNQVVQMVAFNVQQPSNSSMYGRQSSTRSRVQGITLGSTPAPRSSMGYAAQPNGAGYSTQQAIQYPPQTQYVQSQYVQRPGVVQQPQGYPSQPNGAYNPYPAAQAATRASGIQAPMPRPGNYGPRNSNSMNSQPQSGYPTMQPNMGHGNFPQMQHQGVNVGVSSQPRRSAQRRSFSVFHSPCMICV